MRAVVDALVVKDHDQKKSCFEFLAEKAAAAKAAAAQAEKVVPVRLKPWAESVRAVPNAFLRSALFGAIGKGKRRHMEREQLAALHGLKVFCTGLRFDQGDLDAYESVLHSLRLQTMGDECRVTSYLLLKLMGKTDSGKNRETLHKRLTRLRANTIEIEQGHHAYIGGLISEAFKDNETQEWVIVLNSKLLALFGPDQFTQVEWAVRRKLDGQPLAQWLHGFYASHAKPFPMKVASLHSLCGSEAVLMSDFVKTLRKALDAVAKVSGGFFDYDIRGDLVHVEKKVMGAQRRHLDRKAVKPRKPRG